jgi:hypothetical protein
MRLWRNAQRLANHRISRAQKSPAVLGGARVINDLGQVVGSPIGAVTGAFIASPQISFAALKTDWIIPQASGTPTFCAPALGRRRQRS